MTFFEYSNKSIQKLYSELKTEPENGLTSQAALHLLSTSGKNTIKGKEETPFGIFVRQFKSAFLYMLVGAGIISLFLGEMIDGLMIFAFVIINALLGFYQEFRSHQALKLLGKYVASKTTVLRDGKQKDIDSSDLVVGDIVCLTPGDIIRADIRIIEENNLFTDESILTGESVPVKKSSQSLKSPAKVIYKASNVGFSGTTVISGKGKGVVVATGMNTAIGNIAKLTTQTDSSSSFEKNITKLSEFVLRLIGVTLVLVFFSNFLVKGFAINIPELIVFTIALAVSVIPEALPVVTTFSLSRGALVLAKHKVVVKRLSAIEDLGSIEVLCTDKTGTLTENKLKVTDIKAENPRTAAFFAALVSDGGIKHDKIDPFDAALWDYLTKKEQASEPKYIRLDEIPFDPQRKRNSAVLSHEGKTTLYTRGAPEEILKICNKQNDKKYLNWISEQGKLGRRVLALAFRDIQNSENYDIKKLEKNMTLVGMFSFVDPLKSTAAEALKKAKTLGLSIKILTGDSKDVAAAVAKKIGLIDNIADVITGEKYDLLPDSDKHLAVEHYSVFARVSPEQKYEIIKLLEERHEVGFLGEGINDAPALKIANVALAVQGASDIARDSADIILLNKSLDVIVDGIGEGRKVFANTIKYIKATLASNFGNFFAVATATLISDYLPLLPLQILLLNLLSDFPMISIATDTVEPADLEKPETYNLREIAFISIVLGTVSTIFDFIFFALFYKISPSVLQTNWFIGSVITELMLFFSIRTKGVFYKAKRASSFIIFLSVGVILLTLALPFTTIGQKAFNFTPPIFHHLSLVFLVVGLYFVSTETVKLFYYKFLYKENS